MQWYQYLPLVGGEGGGPRGGKDPAVQPGRRRLWRSQRHKLLTADDLLRLIFGEGVRGELIRGVFHEIMSSGLEHGQIAAKLTILLGIFIMPRRLGTLATSDVGVWLERDPDTVREPDIAYFSAARLPLDVRITGYAEVPSRPGGGDCPLLVILSARSATRRGMWLSYGVALVWIVQPDTRTVGRTRAGPCGGDAHRHRHARTVRRCCPASPVRSATSSTHRPWPGGRWRAVGPRVARTARSLFAPIPS